MTELHLTTTLEPRGPAAAIVLSDEQVAVLGDAKAFPVVVTIGASTARLRLARMGGENLVGLSKAARAELGVEVGQEVDVVLRPDDAPREVEVPAALAEALDAAGLREEARFIVFRCADNLNGQDYYESVDLIDAYHPQTIVAHRLNGEPLPIRNGAPLRMRIERQLGYKHAKYLTGIEAVASLDDIGLGKGGYWEDRAGYQWYAGI